MNRHIDEYVFTDSETERKFVRELDTSEEGNAKHVYFIAKTKGSMSSIDLRLIEDCKIACARKFFSKITSDQVKYDVVNSYRKLMELVK